MLQFLHLEAWFLKVFNISITNFGVEQGMRKLTPIVPSLFSQNVLEMFQSETPKMWRLSQSLKTEECLEYF